MRIEMDETEYRIVGDDGEEGPETEYGEVAVLRVGEAVYYAVIEDPNEGTPVVYRVDAVSEVPTTVEDVVFEGADDAVAGDDEDEDEDEDEDDEAEADDEEEDDEEEGADSD
jgi:hypothetical protein